MVMFLDEPTTGLDILAGHRCMEHLKHLVDDGRTIICTIHQPSATMFHLFDIIYLIADGRCLYQGDVDHLMPFLESIGAPCNKYHNPADHVIEVASGDYGSNKIELMVDHIGNGKKLNLQVKMTDLNVPQPPSEVPKKSGCYELGILAKREIVKLRRNMTLTHLRLFGSVMISVALGAIYWDVGNDASKMWFNYNLVIVSVFQNIVGGLMLTVLDYKKTILKNISGYFPSGKLVGILGPSGAGKSTLLNVLSGYKTKGMDGIIETNGVERNLKEFKSKSCYITQDNDLNGLLTVEENMQFAADLKLGRSVSDKTKVEMINNLLKTFGLSEARHNRTSIISGGQKKRLSVAQELLSNPLVLFLDEPTTGLDSVSSYRCIEYLKRLASQGRTIICTIHQPSATQFALLDMVYILSEGKCLYKGDTNQLVDFLDKVGLPCSTTHNPADYVIELASGEYGDDKIDIMVKASDNGNYLPSLAEIKDKIPLRGDIARMYEMQTKHKCERSKSNTYEFLVLLRREYVKLTRHLFFMYLRVFASIFIGLAIGIVYMNLGSKSSKIWFNYNLILAVNANTVCVSVMLTVISFPIEMAIVRKEFFNGYYSLWNYFISITLLDLPLSCVCTLMSTVIVYYLTDQPMELFRIGIFLTIGILEATIAQSIGLFLGASTNLKNAVLLGSYSHVVFMVFSGFGMMFADIPKHFYWITYLCYISYAVTSQSAAVYGYNREKLNCTDDIYCHYSYGRDFLDDVGIDGEHFWVNFGVLLSFYLLCRAISYKAMSRRLQS